MPDSPNTILDDATRKTEAGIDATANATASGFQAYSRAGEKASVMLGDVNKAMTDAYAQSISNFNALSQQAMNCRTAADVITLQTSAMDQFQQNMTNMAQIYALMVKGMTASLSPLTAEATAQADSAARTVGR